ncbi:uncharacterized protein K452DRAFT_286816, partial [Aplosporella prunicola CBS 121167]
MINALPKGVRAIKRAVVRQGPSADEPTRARSESLSGSSSNRVNGRDATMGEDGEARASNSPPRARHAARKSDTDAQMGHSANQRPGPAPPYKINKTMNNLSWSLIIGMALREHPNKTASVCELYQWIADHIEESDIDFTKLKSNTAAYLTQGPAFIKGPRVGDHPSAHYWILDRKFTSNFPNYREVVQRARLIQDLHQRNGPNTNRAPPANNRDRASAKARNASTNAQPPPTNDRDRASARARNLSTNVQPLKPSVRQALEFITRHRVTYDDHGRDIVPGSKNTTGNSWHELPRRNTVTIKGVPFHVGDYVKLPLPAKPFHSSFEHVPHVEAIGQIEDLRVRDEGAGCAVLVQWYMNKEAADRFECRHRQNWPKSNDGNEAEFVRCALWDIITSDSLQEKLDPSTAKKAIFETHFMEIDTDQGKVFLKEKGDEWPWYGVAFEDDIDKTVRLQGQNKISVHGRFTGYNGLRKTLDNPTWDAWLHMAFPEDYPSNQTNGLSPREETSKEDSRMVEDSTAEASENASSRSSEGSTARTSEDATAWAKDGAKGTEEAASSKDMEVTMTEAEQDDEMPDAQSEENQSAATPANVTLADQLFTPSPQHPPAWPESPGQMSDLDIEMTPAPTAELARGKALQEVMERAVEKTRSEMAAEQTAAVNGTQELERGPEQSHRSAPDRVHTKTFNELLQQAETYALTADVDCSQELEQPSEQVHRSAPEPVQESARGKAHENPALGKAPDKTVGKAPEPATKPAPQPDRVPSITGPSIAGPSIASSSIAGPSIAGPSTASPSIAGPSKTTTNPAPANTRPTQPALSEGKVDILAALKAEFDKQPFNVKNLLATHPEMRSKVALFDKEAKIKEIEKRPKRKDCLTNSFARARRERPRGKPHNELERPLPSTYKPPASYEGEGSRPRDATFSFDERYWGRDSEMSNAFSSQEAEKFETLEELLDLPKERIPILYENRHLAYRDGTLTNGRLSRAKEIWKVGRNVPGEL